MAQSHFIVAKNRRARHEYHVEETLEAGIVLQGSEVKSIREGRISLQEAYCRIEPDGMLLLDCHIAPYSLGDKSTMPDSVRPRRLLLHRHQLRAWKKASTQKGYTIVPLEIYFRDGYAKVKIGLGKGKKLYDKRSDMARREAQRRIERAVRKGP